MTYNRFYFNNNYKYNNLIDISFNNIKKIEWIFVKRFQKIYEINGDHLSIILINL